MTGYTDEAVKTRMNFPDFARRCARAFGFMITLRDEPLSSELPQAFEVDSYYRESVTKAEADWQEWHTLRPGERASLVERRRQESNAATREYQEVYRAENAYLRGLLAQVEAWDAPAELEGMKDFMREQITTSLHDEDFDASLLDRSEARTTEELMVNREEALLHRLESARKSLREEEKRVADRNRCLSLLRESLTAFESRGTVNA